MNPDSRLLYLPQASRYAVSAAACLAALPDDGYHTVAKLAARAGLSSSYLAKILQCLAQKGLLDSRRGTNGGYRLSRPAEEVSLSEIVAASHRMEAGPVPCMIEARDCDASGPCAMHPFVELTEGSMWRRLEGTLLADLATSSFLNKGEKK